MKENSFKLEPHEVQLPDIIKSYTISPEAYERFMKLQEAVPMLLEMCKKIHQKIDNLGESRWFFLDEIDELEKLIAKSGDLK